MVFTKFPGQIEPSAAFLKSETVPSASAQLGTTTSPKSPGNLNLDSRSFPVSPILDFCATHRHRIDEREPFFEIKVTVGARLYATVLADEDEYRSCFTHAETELLADGFGFPGCGPQRGDNPTSSL